MQVGRWRSDKKADQRLGAAIRGLPDDVGAEPARRRASFPTQIGVPFPTDFQESVRNIFRRLFRIYAHIYYCHFERMSALGAEPHLNTCFKHYMYFVYEFDLIPKKEELAPLQELIDKLMERDAEQFRSSAAGRVASSSAATAAGDSVLYAPAAC